MTLQKIIHNKDFFINKNTLFVNNEETFQQLVKQELPKILSRDLGKKIYVYKCVYKFYSRFGNAMPDLIAIADDYSYFSIIEVEISNHDFESHVEVQMKSLINSDYKNYERDIFTHIHNHNDNVRFKNIDLFEKMLQDIEPEFIVVAEKFIKEWQIWLEQYKTRFISISPHLNDQNEYSFLVTDSKIPKQISKFKIQWTKYFFTLNEKGNKYFEDDNLVDIYVGEDIYKFQVMRETEAIYLIPSGSSNIMNAHNENFLNQIHTIECTKNFLTMIWSEDEN